MSKGVKDTDFGMDSIRKEIEAFKHMGVKAGIVEGSGNVDGVSIADYAAWNEFGVPGKKKKWRIPPRPFIRGWVENHGEEIKQTIDKLYDLVAGGRLTASTAIKRLGQFAQDGIKRYIISGAFTPNSESTVKQKGSSRPLIDTGTMRNSVRYEVIKK